jgi:hypothetical protein
MEDFNYGRVRRLLSAVAGDPVITFSGAEGIETFSDRIEPFSKGQRSQMW